MAPDRSKGIGLKRRVFIKSLGAGIAAAMLPFMRPVISKLDMDNFFDQPVDMKALATPSLNLYDLMSRIYQIKVQREIESGNVIDFYR